MAGPLIYDRVKETTTTTGTGTYTLAGAVTGFLAFSTVGNGNTCHYCVENGTDWEVGLGTYTASGTTLARTTILASSNSGSAVDWGAGTKNVFLTAPAAHLARYYVKVEDQKAQNTSGGTFTAGAWQTRTLNTEVNDDAGICTLASNQITLAAGTYECRISAPAAFVESHQARLQNVTAGTTLVLGTVEYAGVAAANYAATRSHVNGRFTVAASQALEVQHYCSSTDAVGFGFRMNVTTEVYTTVEFWKVG